MEVYVPIYFDGTPASVIGTYYNMGEEKTKIMTTYTEMAQTIINKHISVLGKTIAVNRAKRVQGLKMGDAGQVEELSDGAPPTDIIEELIKQYAELLGSAAISFSKDAALPIIKKNPGLELSRSLK